MSADWISFNSVHDRSSSEKQWIRTLFSPLREVLTNHQIVNIIRPVHISGDDVLEHITFRIFDKLTDVRDLPFLRYQDYHAYLWGDQIEFVTQYEKKNKLVVY